RCASGEVCPNELTIGTAVLSTGLQYRHCESEGRTMRLLIVEDDRELREALSALLRQAGYEVDAFADGRDAFNSLLSSDYDLAIVDLMLPGMNGLALVRSLRRQLCGLPILIVTARDALEDR